MKVSDLGENEIWKMRSFYSQTKNASETSKIAQYIHTWAQFV